MERSVSDAFAEGAGAVAAGVDTPGFRKEVARFLDSRGFPPGAFLVHLDPLCPGSCPVTACLLAEGGEAKTRFEASASALDNGVPTPRPLAWVQLNGTQSVLFTERIPGTLTLEQALLRLYYEQPFCEPLMNLLQVCADAVSAMHRAGWEHGYLTTAHLLVRATSSGDWEGAWIQGLSGRSAASSQACPPRIRGRDNGLIRLPSDFLRVFLEMQWAPELPPDDFLAAEKAARNTSTPAPSVYDANRPFPEEKDIWIWDHRSRQAIPALKSRDKRKYYRKRDAGPLLGASLRYGPGIRRETKKWVELAWSSPVDLDQKLGISLNLEPDRFERELKWLEPLASVPVLGRIYHHETEAHRRYAVDAVRRLHSLGHRVTVALVQDRDAVMNPNKWKRFVDWAAGGLSGFAEAVEIGHAINRVKWGIWTVPEYRQLVEPFQNWKDRYPQLPLIGPAGIDFEFPRVLPMLNQWPAGSLSAFSHHLYVDRRGAPENTQSGYDLVRKLAMARAISRVHPACAERVVVSEVNWPLKGTGVWSPVGSPYQSAGERTGDPSVDEETYADYLRRYVLLAICSGLADRVYWWNLVAHGFGLVDDRDPAGWRPRPGYHAFKEIAETFRNSRFEKRTPSAEGWTYHFTRNQEPHTLETPHIS